MRRAGALALAGCLGASLTVVAGGSPAAGVASGTIAYWQMNEPRGATQMLDSGPNHIDGTIGSQVTTGGSYAGATGYSWDYTPPNTPPAHRERLVEVNSSLLNPGTAEYAVTLRYRTTRPFGNIIQKGQNKTAGGYFKIELPKGFVTCLFKDGSGGQAGATSTIAIDDGAWHTITCERNKANVTVRIDDDYVRRTAKATGSIANSNPLTIAGKASCDQVEVTCDYFVGQIDWVRIQGGEADTPPPAPTGITGPVHGVRDGSGAVYVPAPDDAQVTTYVPGKHGHGTYARTLGGDRTGLEGPWGTARDDSGNLYVAGAGNDAVRVFPAGASGNAAPTRSIAGAKTGLDWPEGIALDSHGVAYVANFLADSVTVYAAGASGDVRPVRTIQGARTGLDEPVGVAVDAAGRVYVTSWDAGSVVVFAPGADGNVAPERVIDGPATGLAQPYAVALDADGTVFVANDGDAKVRTYAPGASGNSAPATTVAVPDGSGILIDPGYGISPMSVTRSEVRFTDLRTPATSPGRVAPGQVRALRVTGKKRATHRKVRWHAPASDGGAAVTRYKVVVRHSGDKVLTRRVAAPTHKLRLARSWLPRGTCRVVVKAKNAAGYGAKAKVAFKVR